MLPWFPGDFMTATRGWSVTARGVYRELLDAQWDMGALPADLEELRVLINATAAEWRVGWQKCEMKFPVGEDGLRRNGRLESHRLKAARLTEAKQNGARITNAKRGAQRADSDTDSERSADRTALASISVSVSNPSPSRLQTTQTPPTPSRGAGPERVGVGLEKVREKLQERWIPPTEEQIRAGK
jgi:uncharacterized protein YdaU (DUF1376 family)